MENNFKLTIDYSKFVEVVQANRGQQMNIDENCYYHSTPTDNVPFIMQNGILSKKKQGKEAGEGKSTGDHHIAITRQNNLADGSYKSFIIRGFSFVINPNIKVYETIQCRCRKIHYTIDKTSLPIRFCEWPDEWHVKDEIRKEDLIALQYFLLDKLVKSEITGTDATLRIRQLIETMSELQIDMPLLDGSDRTEINKEVFTEYVKRR